MSSSTDRELKQYQGDDQSLPFKQRAYRNYRYEMARMRKYLEILGGDDEEEEDYDDEEEEDYDDEEEEKEERDDRPREEQAEEFLGQPLCITIEEQVTIDLSTGGPADRIVIVRDRETKEVESGYYLFQDWGEGERFYLNNDELDLVEDVYAISSYE